MGPLFSVAESAGLTGGSSVKAEAARLSHILAISSNSWCISILCCGSLNRRLIIASRQRFAPRRATSTITARSSAVSFIKAFSDGTVA